MRKKDKQITERSEIDNVIFSTDVCRLAFAKNNIPYIVPVSFGYDCSNIFIHTAVSGRKIDFIKENNLICFEFETDVRTIASNDAPCKWTAAFKSVVGYGKIIEITEYNERISAINQIMLHYSGKEWFFNEKMMGNMKLWKIIISEISGKKSG